MVGAGVARLSDFRVEGGDQIQGANEAGTVLEGAVRIIDLGDGRLWLKN